MTTDNLYSAKDVRELDRLAIEEHNIPGYTLMYRAGEAAFQALLHTWPLANNIIVYCGSGNNGGDGYVIAGLAQQHGLRVSVIFLGDLKRLKGSAKRAMEFASNQGLVFTAFDEERAMLENGSQTIVVDAMLGTGISGNVSGEYLKAIEEINQSGLPVLAIDIPSGLCSDTGKVLGVAVKANLTISFIGLKIGQTINAGPEYCGELLYDDLGVPKEIFKKVKPV